MNDGVTYHGAMNNDEHRAIRESLGSYLLDGLPDVERSTVAAHLEGCPDCRAELTAIEPAARALSLVAPEALTATPVPPAWLGERIVERVRDQQARDQQARTRGVQHPRSAGMWLDMWRGAAVAVVAALIGAMIGYQAGSGPQPPRESVAIESRDQQVSVSATVIPHTWGVEITLDATGFAPGAVYRVVVLDNTGRPVDAGQFIGTGNQRMVCNLNTSILRADASGFDVIAVDGGIVVHGSL